MTSRCHTSKRPGLATGPFEFWHDGKHNAGFALFAEVTAAQREQKWPLPKRLSVGSIGEFADIPAGVKISIQNRRWDEAFLMKAKKKSPFNSSARSARQLLTARNDEICQQQTSPQNGGILFSWGI